MRPVEGYPSVVLTQSRVEVLAAAMQCDSHVLLVFEPDRRTLLGAVKTATVVRHRGDWDLARLTEGLPYFQRREVLGQVLQRLRRAGAHAGVVIGRTGQPEGIIDSRSIVDAVLGMGGQSCPTRSGQLGWRDGRSFFARSGRDVG
jgi:hypothetical protein